MRVHPRSDPELVVAEPRCRIDVVHTVLEAQVEHAIGDTLVGRLEPALPKTTAELMWPVRPNGRF